MSERVKLLWNNQICTKEVALNGDLIWFATLNFAQLDNMATGLTTVAQMLKEQPIRLQARSTRHNWHMVPLTKPKTHSQVYHMP